MSSENSDPEDEVVQSSPISPLMLEAGVIRGIVVKAVVSPRRLESTMRPPEIKPVDLATTA